MSRAGRATGRLDWPETLAPCRVIAVIGPEAPPDLKIGRVPDSPERQQSMTAPERPFFRPDFDDVASVTYSFQQSNMAGDVTSRLRESRPAGRRRARRSAEAIEEDTPQWDTG
jgi:hypothetical protein